MKKRRKILMTISIFTFSLMVSGKAAQAEEINGAAAIDTAGVEHAYDEDAILPEENEVQADGSGAPGQSDTEIEAGELVIEAIEVVSVTEPSAEEKKAVDEMAKAMKQREEKAKEEALKENPIIGFHVNPLDYPAANVSENTRQIYVYLTEELELNHAAACGVLANIHLESSFFPLALGDGGTSYGICQWHLGRFNGLIAYCNANGFDYNTLEGQLHYLQYELETGYTGVLSYLREVPDTEAGAYDAAYYWCIGFEKPDDMYYRGARRGNLAKNEYFPKDLTQVQDDSEEDQEALQAHDWSEQELTLVSAATGFWMPAMGEYAEP